MLTRRAPSGPNIHLASYPSSSASPNGGTAKTIDWSQGPVQHLTLNADCAITSDGLPPGEAVPDLYLTLTQANGGLHTVLFVGAKTPGGQGISPSSANGSITMVHLTWDGFQLFADKLGEDYG